MDIKGSRLLVPSIGFDGNVGPDRNDYILGNIKYLNRNVNPCINIDILIFDIIKSMNPSKDNIGSLKSDLEFIKYFPALFYLWIPLCDYYTITEEDIQELSKDSPKLILNINDKSIIELTVYRLDDKLIVVCKAPECQFVSIFYKHFKPMYEWACKHCNIE